MCNQNYLNICDKLCNINISANLPVPRLCVQGTDTIDLQQQWTFDDGTLMTYFNWNQNKPLGGRGNIGIVITLNFTWFDVAGVIPKLTCVFICQK